MSQSNQVSRTRDWLQFSTDGWAVIAALVFAALVRIGLIHRVPW